MNGGLNRHGVVRGSIVPDFAAAVKHETAAMEIAPPVTVGKITTFQIDPRVAGETVYVLPYHDPAGLLVDGFPWASPRLEFEFTTLIPDSSGIAVLVGMLDGTAPSTDQWIAGGAFFNSVTGPRAQADSSGVGPFASAAVAGGMFFSMEAASTLSSAVVGTLITRGDVTLAPNKLGGSGATSAVTPLDDYAKVPHLIYRVTSAGTSLAASMTFAGIFSYRGPFKSAEPGA